MLGHNLHKHALIFHLIVNLVSFFLLSYNGILMSSSCFVIWQVCNANGTGDLWGHSDCAQAPVFTAPFTGMDFHSV